MAASQAEAAGGRTAPIAGPGKRVFSDATVREYASIFYQRVVEGDDVSYPQLVHLEVEGLEREHQIPLPGGLHHHPGGVVQRRGEHRGGAGRHGVECSPRRLH